VKGVGQYIGDPNEQQIIENNLLVPSGKTIPNNNSISTKLKFNEYIIYDPKRALIRFVVEVKPTNFCNIM